MSNLYRTTTYSLGSLIEDISEGRIGLPDIQRPFVWGATKARELIDSMYRGFPVGTLLFWDTGADASLRQIDDSATSVAKLAIVDGQQRLTSLYAILTGEAVLTKNFKERHIRIAFNPVAETFDVYNAAIRQNPEYLPDISAIWVSHRQTVRDFLARLQASRQTDITQQDKDLYEDRIDRVRDLQRFAFHAIEINERVEADVVAEVFVRTNSQGVILNRANFILTLMSVYWDKGRRQLEGFCREARIASPGRRSPRNPFIDPDPDQMLRVSVGLAFRRGSLATVYNILRGKDLDTGEISEERRDRQFRELRRAQDEVLDLTNWSRFLGCLRRAGFRDRRMITSEIAVLYCYVIWLIGRRDTNADSSSLDDAIARWFFMAHATRRYTGSSESQLQSDLNRISQAGSDGQAFLEVLDRLIGVEFTSDFWEITLPNQLDTSAPKSAPLSAYWAALVLLDAETLLGRQRVRDLLDAGPRSKVSLDRDLLFPRAYLATLGLKKSTDYNAIANTGFMDQPVDVSKGASGPADYWPPLAARFASGRLDKQARLHALPIGWEQLDYAEFLEKRRKLMARVSKQGFSRIGHVPGQASTSLQQLLKAGESQTLEFKSTARYNQKARQSDKAMEHVIVKTVAGFLNSDGGTLLIGVDDQGTVLGLEPDFSSMTKARRNTDSYELWLRQRLDTDLSISTAKVVEIAFEETLTGTVCVVSVSSSGKPVFARAQDGGTPASDFWVRVGNATKQLYGNDQYEYTRDHWN